MRRSDQRRAAVVALYQHDLTGRPLIETLGPKASLFARALAHAAADRADELDAILDRHAHGWSVQRIQPLEREHHARGADRDAASDAAPAEEPIRLRGRSRRRWRARRRLRLRRAGVRERGARRRSSRSARDAPRRPRHRAGDA